MSGSEFENFLHQLDQDDDLQSEFRDLAGDDAESVAIDEVIGFAAGKGYSFTVDDISNELSDAELDEVAGGGVAVFPKVEIDLASSTTGLQYVKIDLRRGMLAFKF